MSDNEMPTLFAWAGGEPAIRRMINAFYDRVEHDDLLGPLFPGRVSEEHRVNVGTWWIEVFGGPGAYTEQHGGYENTLTHHHNLKISPAQRFRFASLMSLAADDTTARRPRVQGRARRLPRVWNPTRDAQLAPRQPGRRTCTRATMGMESRAAIHALNEREHTQR